MSWRWRSAAGALLVLVLAATYVVRQERRQFEAESRVKQVQLAEPARLEFGGATYLEHDAPPETAVIVFTRIDAGGDSSSLFQALGRTAAGGYVYAIPGSGEDTSSPPHEIYVTHADDEGTTYYSRVR